VAAAPAPRPLAPWLVGVNLGLAALCVVAAGLQLNDPDPLRWIAFYLAAAAAGIAALHVAGGWRAAAVVALAAAAWSAVLWWGVVDAVDTTDLWRRMDEKGGRVEEYREALGLTLVAAWLGAAALLGRRRW
jgi:hypothetical protein